MSISFPVSQDGSLKDVDRSLSLNIAPCGKEAGWERASSYGAAMNPDTITMSDISAKLRTLRRARGWSLLDVELQSKGKIKAVVVGSYERGTRTLSVKRAIEIAQLYEVPLSQLFTEKSYTPGSISGRKMLDLRTISRKAQIENQWTERFLILTRFTRAIVESRQDWNGEVLSLRSVDCGILALILNIDEAELMNWLDQEKILLTLR